MVKVSVVMPVYNSERFLKDSINSILNQTLSDIELICVDDGSSDSSLDILNKFAKCDKRVKIFSLNHEGAGNARNYAIPHTSGEFLYFMDSDDYLDLNAFEDFYSITKSKNLDFLLFKLINYDVDEDRYYETKYYNMPEISNFVKDKVFNYKDLGDLIFKINASTCSKFYNRDFVIRTGARFRENSKFNDNQFFWDIIFYAERIYFLDEFYYTRTRHSASLTGAKDKHHIDTIGVLNDVIDLFAKHNQLDKHKKFLYNKKISKSLVRYNEIQDEYKELFFVELKKDFKRLENTEFRNTLLASSQLYYDIVLISKDFQDFVLLRKLYFLINNGKLSYDEKVSSIEKWFISLNEFYRGYFFNIIKFWFKKFPSDEVSSDNKKFFEDIIMYGDYGIYCKSILILSNFDKLNYLTADLKKDINEGVGSNKINEKFNKLDEIHNYFKSELMLLMGDENYKELKKFNPLIVEKDSLISDLSDEVSVYKSEVVEKDSLISDLSDEVSVYKSEVVEKDSLISDLNDKLKDMEKIIRKNTIELDKLKSQNTYLQKNYNVSNNSPNNSNLIKHYSKKDLKHLFQLQKH